MDVAEEQRMLEEKVGKALEEARAKLDAAIDHLSKGGAESEKKVWWAEEAAEYSSLLYSLTYSLEDEDRRASSAGQGIIGIPTARDRASGQITLGRVPISQDRGLQA